jgi:hypothetical protein
MAWRSERCILHSAKISIDLVAKKCSNRRTNFETSNARSKSYPALFCASSGAVERHTTTEISFCLDLDPKASPGDITRIEDRLYELFEVSGIPGHGRSPDCSA